MASSTASLISCFCESMPPMSEYLTSGRSSARRRAMDESASGGRMSTSEWEWRWRATDDDGLSSSRSSVDKIRTT